MASVTKTVIDALFRQYPAAREIRDFVLLAVKASGMPTELPAIALREPQQGAMEKLVVKFNDGSTFCVTLEIEARKGP